MPPIRTLPLTYRYLGRPVHDLWLGVRATLADIPAREPWVDTDPDLQAAFQDTIQEVIAGNVTTPQEAQEFYAAKCLEFNWSPGDTYDPMPEAVENPENPEGPPIYLPRTVPEARPWAELPPEQTILFDLLVSVTLTLSAEPA